MDDHKKLKRNQESFSEKASFLIHVTDKKRPERKLDALLRVQTEKYKNLSGTAGIRVRVDLERGVSACPKDVELQRCRLPVMEARCKADSCSQRISFSDGYVVVDPPQLQGLHIGTYIFNLIIEWAIANFPSYGVIPIMLRAEQSLDPENKIRRNLFYDNFGFCISYTDEAHATGHSLEDLLASQLNTRKTWEENIVIIDETAR